jgi:hypothetical protein
MEPARAPASISAAVAGVAVADHYARHSGWNVHRWFSLCRRVGSTMAGGTFACDHLLGVVPLARQPACSAVAHHTITCSWNVNTWFTSCATAVMATSALGGRCVQTVVGFGSAPAAGGLMAGLAIASDCGVNRCRGFTGYTICRTKVASRALRRYRHVAMETSRIPCGITTAVTGIAIADHHPRDGGGDMHRGLTLRRRVGTCVACAALGGDHLLGMVPFGGRPGCGAVANQAVACGGDVRTSFPGCATAVVAVCALCR